MTPRGGKRHGAGPPAKFPALGGRMIDVTVKLPPRMIAYIKHRGGGSIPAGLRAIVLRSMRASGWIGNDTDRS